MSRPAGICLAAADARPEVFHPRRFDAGERHCGLRRRGDLKRLRRANKGGKGASGRGVACLPASCDTRRLAAEPRRLTRAARADTTTTHAGGDILSERRDRLAQQLRQRCSGIAMSIREGNKRLVHVGCGESHVHEATLRLLQRIGGHG